MKDLYTNYLECKLGFTENLLLFLINTYDKGGTLPVFQTFEEWTRMHTASQQADAPDEFCRCDNPDQEFDLFRGYMCDKCNKLIRR